MQEHRLRAACVGFRFIKTANDKYQIFIMYKSRIRIYISSTWKVSVGGCGSEGSRSLWVGV